MRIRTTDDISFKLLGLVPLVSGAGMLVVLREDSVALSPSMFLISAFGAIVTFGLFRWELRNIQTCNWLVERAKAMEGRVLGDNGQGPFFGRWDAPPLTPSSPGKWGKTEAEKLIYAATIVVWLGLPWAAFLNDIGEINDPAILALAVPQLILSLPVVLLTYAACRVNLKGDGRVPSPSA
jgi:hypothetical protein